MLLARTVGAHRPIRVIRAAASPQRGAGRRSLPAGLGPRQAGRV